jgi:hypothetical protein
MEEGILLRRRRARIMKAKADILGAYIAFLGEANGYLTSGALYLSVARSLLGISSVTFLRPNETISIVLSAFRDTQRSLSRSKCMLLVRPSARLT